MILASADYEDAQLRETDREGFCDNPISTPTLPLQKQHQCVKSISHLGTKAPCYFVVTVLVAITLTSDLHIGISWAPSGWHLRPTRWHILGSQWLAVVSFLSSSSPRLSHKTMGF